MTSKGIAKGPGLCLANLAVNEEHGDTAHGHAGPNGNEEESPEVESSSRPGNIAADPVRMINILGDGRNASGKYEEPGHQVGTGLVEPGELVCVPLVSNVQAVVPGEEAAVECRAHLQVAEKSLGCRRWNIRS